MTRKLFLAIATLAIIAVVAASGFIMLNNTSDTPAHITINYTYQHGQQTEVDTTGSYTYTGPASWVIFTLNATSTKDVAVFDQTGFNVTSNGQPLTVLKVNPEQMTLYSGKYSEGKLGFVVEGDVNTFELIYNGPTDVTIT